MKPLILFILATFASSCDRFQKDEEEEEATLAVSVQQPGSITLEQSSLRLTADEPSIGAAKASQMTSFKYYIYSIRICESLTPTGSGYSNPSGCLDLFTREGPDYDSFDEEQAKQTTDGYIDLMNKEELASKLSFNVDVPSSILDNSPVPDQVSFNFGIINWYRQLKITASVTLKDGRTVYTKSGTLDGTGVNRQAQG